MNTVSSSIKGLAAASQQPSVSAYEDVRKHFESVTGYLDSALDRIHSTSARLIGACGPILMSEFDMPALESLYNDTPERSFDSPAPLLSDVHSKIREIDLRLSVLHRLADILSDIESNIIK